jgi:hypothetical protein
MQGTQRKSLPLHPHRAFATMPLRSRLLAMAAALLTCALPAGASAPEIAPDVALAERFVHHYANADWDAIRRETSVDSDSPVDDAVLAAFSKPAAWLGEFHSAVMASREPEGDCFRQRHVLRHARDLVALALLACPEGPQWRIRHMQLSPGMRGTVALFFHDRIAAALGTAFHAPHCLDYAPPPGVPLQCRAATADGRTLHLQLASTGPGHLAVTGEPSLTAAPPTSREALETAARQLFERYGNGDFEAIADAASPSFGQADRPTLLATLRAWSTSLGPVQDMHWKGMDTQRGVVTVELAIDVASGPLSGRLDFVPGAARWELSRLELDLPEHSAAWQASMGARLDAIARNLTADPGARVQCDGAVDPAPGATTRCRLDAHGRRADVEVRAVAPTGATRETSVVLEDFDMILHAAIAAAEPLMGWNARSVACDPPRVAGGARQCVVTSPGSERRVTVMADSRAPRIIDIRQR